MSQIRTTSFHSLDTSMNQNAQIKGVIRPGVYQGYKLRVNAAQTNYVDITPGSDPASILVTREGVRIEETTEVPGAFVIQNADANLTRIDLAVAEYQFSTNTAIKQVYKVVRGQYGASITATPPRPIPQNAYQIPLAFITVRPQSASGTGSRANIRTEDISHIEPASLTRGPQDISSLLPIIEPSDNGRVFIHAGSFPTFDGARRINFFGGHSAVISATGLTNNTYKYYMFGLSDTPSVALIGSASTEADLPNFIQDVLPICSVRGTVTNGRIVFSELRDLRFPFTRQTLPQFEEEAYKNLLSESVFDHLRVESFRTMSGLVLDSINDTTVTPTLNRADTSVSFVSTGIPTNDVTISTTNLLRDTAIGTVQYAMIAVDSNIQNLKIKFSTSGPYGGFPTYEVMPNTIFRIPAGGGSKLYIRFVIPRLAFSSSVPTMYSFGAFFNLNEDVLNAGTISDVSLDSLKYSIPNLIANGNFRFWSRDDINGNTPDVDSQIEIMYPISADKPFSADGWQFTQWNYESETGQISRVGLSRDVFETGVSNTNDTALQWSGVGATTPAGSPNRLEYRIPVPPGTGGQRITFSLNFHTGTAGVMRIGIALYELATDKKLKYQNLRPTYTTPTGTSGTAVVVSETQVNERTVCVGFLVEFYQQSASTTVNIWRAMAAVGEFRTLPYNETTDATDILRKYYERGRVLVGTTVVEGDTLGTSVQFGAKKHTVLGPLEAQTISESDSNRSVNVGALVYDVDANGLAVTAEAISGGIAKIDADFEAFIRYAEVVDG